MVNPCHLAGGFQVLCRASQGMVTSASKNPFATFGQASQQVMNKWCERYHTVIFNLVVNRDAFPLQVYIFPTQSQQFAGSCTTNIQGQLFSVGFVISGLSPSHAGCVADLPVLRDPAWSCRSPQKRLFRFFSALCSQKILENPSRLAQAERHIYQVLAPVSQRRVFQADCYPDPITISEVAQPARNKEARACVFLDSFDIFPNVSTM